MSIDLKPGKLTNKDTIKQDFIDLINRTKKLQDIVLVDSDSSALEKICIDFGYSTRLGYDRTSLKTALKVFLENIRDERINEVFNTSYTKDQLIHSKLFIINNSIEIVEEFEYSTYDDNKEIPEFAFVTILFDAALNA